jgi:hypothetical protein
MGVHEEADSQGDVHGFVVEKVWWFLVQFDQTSGFRVGFVSYEAPLVEFEERRWVDLTQLALRWPKSSLNCYGRGFCRENCGTVAKQLVTSI